MRRVRWLAVFLAAGVAVVAVGGWAWSGVGDGDGVRGGLAAPPRRSAGRTMSSSDPPRPRRSVAEAPAPTPRSPADGALARGSAGAVVEALQRRLVDLHLDPGPVDGRFGSGTAAAVAAFQALQGLPPTGEVDTGLQAALAAPAPVQPRVPTGEPDRVEVDLRGQVLLLWQGGALRLATHVSTGSGERYCADGRCGTADTPTGAFRFSWRYPGWRESRLGRLYNPVYFTSSGIAVHGSTSVPMWPASHGCVRIPMHIAEYFPSLVDRGDAVYVVDGIASAPPPPPVAPSGTPPADPPAAPEVPVAEPPPAAAAPPAAPPTTTTTTTAPAPAPDSTTTSAAPVPP